MIVQLGVRFPFIYLFFLFFCKTDGYVCSAPLMIKVEWRFQGVRQILFISVFAQSLSKSPLLASKLHLHTRRPKPYSFFSSPPPTPLPS